MTEFEALCAGLAAARMTSAVRQALAGVHEDLRAIIYSGDPQRYHEINKAFHSTIYLGSHNSYLAEPCWRPASVCSHFVAHSSEISGACQNRTSSTN